MRRTLAEGWWCAGCEVFEVLEEADWNVNEAVITFCRSCGCNFNVHHEVEIATKEVSP